MAKTCLGCNRSGDTTTREEVEALLSSGTSAGLRYLASVDEARNVRIYTEPLATDTITLAWGADGFSDGYGQPLDEGACPVGVWCGVTNILPATTVQPFFVESATYTVGEGYTPTARDVTQPSDTLRVTNAY